MSDEALTNAAVKWIQRMHDFVNSVDQPPTDQAMHMTDDFTYEDRRTGHIAGLVCSRLDPGLRLLQRAVVLGPGEAESALGELDRMNRELDGSPAA